MSKKVVVVGSINIDLSINIDHFPKPGETIIGKNFLKTFGGKGANQAVAAAKAGADVTMISKVGNDEYGRAAVKKLEEEGINTRNILIGEKEHTGIAMIWIDKNGENSIIVASGANGNLVPEEVQNFDETIKSADVLIMQLEIPLETVKAALDIAYKNGIKVILNPAPAVMLGEELLRKVDIITPNINEIETLSGIKIETEEDILSASKYIHNKGVNYVIVTRGKYGVYLFDGIEFTHVPAYEIETVDTTAAGDVFNGILAALTNEQDLITAIKIANAGAAISVSKKGAQDSVPNKSEIFSFLNKREKINLNTVGQ